MKYLRHFEELKRDTYLSAADKLKIGHPERAKSLSKWAYEIDPVKVDRLHYHSFSFRNALPSEGGIPIPTKISDSGEINYWQIYETNKETIEDEEYEEILELVVNIKSIKYGKKAELLFRFRIPNSPDPINEYEFFEFGMTYESGVTSNFKMSCRKDAVMIKSFLLEEFPEYEKEIREIRLNDIYGTEMVSTISRSNKTKIADPTTGRTLEMGD